MKKILVTGGAGYIGSHTVVELLNQGLEVVVVDNLCNSKKESLSRVKKITGKDFAFYQVDVRDFQGLSKVFDENQIESVIHFAGLKAVGESVEKPDLYFDNNVNGTKVLLDVMQKHGCKKIIFSSSATVYGDPEKLPIDEDCALHTTNPYGETKLQVEYLLKDLAKQNPDWCCVILRYFNPIGAHESGLIGEDPNGIPNNLVPYVAKVATGQLEKVRVFGNDYNTPDGTGVRDYIHVVDLAKGHLSAMKKFGNCGVFVYNLGTGKGSSVLEIISAFSKACGKQIPFEVVSRRPGDIATCFACSKKANDELGWVAQLDIEDMCNSTWNWQSKNPNGYN